MIPLRDENPSQHRAVVTVVLVLANIAVFLYQLSLGEAHQGFILAFGAVPAHITGRLDAPLPGALTMLTSMFLHGGFMHLAGNMLFLWIFGDNVEDVMGRGRFLLFYLLCGFAAALLQVMVNPESRIPMVGASGAISGVMGAYLLLFPRARVLALVPLGFIMQTMRVPALLFLGFWFLLQFISSAVATGGGGGVAYAAHVGGFIAGIVLVFAMRRRDRLDWYRRRL